MKDLMLDLVGDLSTVRNLLDSYRSEMDRHGKCNNDQLDDAMEFIEIWIEKIYDLLDDGEFQ